MRGTLDIKGPLSKLLASGELALVESKVNGRGKKDQKANLSQSYILEILTSKSKILGIISKNHFVTRQK